MIRFFRKHGASSQLAVRLGVAWEMNLRKSVSSKSVLKMVALFVTVILFTQSVAIIEGVISPSNSESREEVRRPTTKYESSFDVTPVPVAESPDWISFDDNSTDPGTPAEAHVTLTDTLGLRVVADFYGFWDRNITLNNETFLYDRPEIPGASYMTISGKPELPRFTQIVEVPHDVWITVDVLQNTSALISNFNITPAQPPSIAIWNPGIDMNFTDVVDEIGNDSAFYPDYAVTLEGWNATEPQVMRGRRLLLVSFYPFQYNPFNNTLKVHSRIEVDINYSFPAQIEAANSSLHSLEFEKIFINKLLNPKTWEPQSYAECGPPTPFVTAEDVYPSFPESGAEYLIIVEDAFKPAADRLAEWKTRKGVPAAVFTTTEARAYASDYSRFDTIEGFISTIYKKWAKVPEYILLFGDSEHIPAIYETKHPDGFFNVKGKKYSADDREVATDLHYFTMEGRKDLFPDFFYSRISVNTLEEADNVVNKILEYEKFPPENQNDDFFNDILATSFFEDGEEPYAYEDRGSGFLTYIDEIREYLDSVTNYQLHLNYTTNSPVADDPQVILKGIHGNVIPYNLEDYPNFKWMQWDDLDGALSNITANIDEGRFFVISFDHGSSENMYRMDLGRFESFDGWAVPRFNTTSVELLQNDKLFPFVFSAACNVGWFDGETDQDNARRQDSVYTNNNESLSEILLRKSDGGAIATIGATRLSYNLLSFYLLEGIIQSFWPSSLEPNNQPLYEFGAALQQGRLHLLTRRENDAIRQVSLEMYHLFGDPETSLWTDVPAEFSVHFPATIGRTSAQSFGFTVRDGENLVPNARVCIQQGTQIYKVQYTNEKGEIYFDIPDISIGPMNVTITKHNFRPNISIVLVDNSAPFEAGQNQGFDLSEVAAGPDPYIYSQWDPLTWHLGGQIKTYDNPCIEIYSITTDTQTTSITTTTAVNSYNLHEGQDYLIRVKILNGGTMNAVNIAVNLSYAYFGAGQSWTEIDTKLINVTQSGDPLIPSTHGQTYVEFQWISTIEGTACFRVGIDLDSDINFANNYGQESAYQNKSSSLSTVGFLMGNPTQYVRYPFIELRQACRAVPIMSASVVGYYSRVLTTEEFDPLGFLGDFTDIVDINESRIFIVEVFYNGELVGGFEINATRIEEPVEPTSNGGLTQEQILLIIAGAAGAVIVIVIVIIKYKKK